MKDEAFDALFLMATTGSRDARRSSRRPVIRGEKLEPMRSNGSPLGAYELDVRARALAPMKSVRQRMADESNAWLIAQGDAVTDLDPMRDRDPDETHRGVARLIEEERIDPADMTVYNGFVTELVRDVADDAVTLSRRSKAVMQEAVTRWRERHGDDGEIAGLKVLEIA